MITLKKTGLNYNKYIAIFMIIVGLLFGGSEVPTLMAGESVGIWYILGAVCLVAVGIMQIFRIGKVGPKYSEIFANSGTVTVSEIASKLGISEDDVVSDLKLFTTGKGQRRNLKATSTIEIEN